MQMSTLAQRTNGQSMTNNPSPVSKLYTTKSGYKYGIRCIYEKAYREPPPFQGGPLLPFPPGKINPFKEKPRSELIRSVDHVEVGTFDDSLSDRPYSLLHTPTREQQAATKRFILYENAKQAKAKHRQSMGNPGEAQRVSAETNRLVEAPQSPTYVKNTLRKPIARLFWREWADEYRFRVDGVTRKPNAPEATAGERITAGLTSPAQRKIIDAGAYVATCKGGFRTFGTATLNSDARQRVADGETTLGKEFSRFLDAANKIKQRGFSVGDDFVEGEAGPIVYLWVAEAPPQKTESGELDLSRQNFHIHFLMDWRVDRQHFDKWAERLESAWGNGFVNLKKVKKQKAASHYLLKALGYVAKGGDSDPDQWHICEKTGETVPNQGFIKGNRYGISRDARAPGWECVCAWEAERMGQIIYETGQELQIRKAHMKKAFAAAQAQKDKAIALKAKANNYKNEKARQKTAEQAENLFKRATDRLQKLFIKKQKQPVGNKYQLTLKGYEQVDSFLKMAVVERQWKPKLADYVEYYGAKLTSFTHQQTKRITDSIDTAKTELDRYWKQILSDVEPPTYDHVEFVWENHVHG